MAPGPGQYVDRVAATVLEPLRGQAMHSRATFAGLRRGSEVQQPAAYGPNHQLLLGLDLELVLDGVDGIADGQGRLPLAWAISA